MRYQHAVNNGISHRFTIKIIIGMTVGIVVGLAIKWIPFSQSLRDILADDIFKTGGKIFLNLIQLLVVPIVLVSLVSGSSSLGDMRHLGRVGGKTIILYLCTTAFAITLAIGIASFFQIGHGLTLTTQQTVKPTVVSIKDVFVDIFPSNPFQALTNGKMLQVIVFALLFGIALAATGERGKKVADLFHSTMEVLIQLINIIMETAPYGVFCLMAALFAQVGFNLIAHLIGYFGVVLLVLLVQLFGTYTLLLRFLGRLNPIIFFRKMYTAMLFAFSVSSSNASIPIVLRTVESRLGVGNAVASFVIPLGSTVNMDGTAVMQGVATIFIANAFHIAIGLKGYLIVILMATLASIGTAGVPSVGLITLAMVLQQVGLPMQGIALIIGVDRLLDMMRTAVNIAGDSMVACLVGKSEQTFNETTFNDLTL